MTSRTTISFSLLAGPLLALAPAGTVAAQLALPAGQSADFQFAHHKTARQVEPEEPASAESAESVLVTPTVMLECVSAQPSETVWAAVSFDIKPEWHTYWPGQNDTGAATEITVKGPPGLRVGPVLWPPPHRYISPGDILDHVHEGTVTALVPITLPADAKPGQTLDLSFDLSWLVCKEVCIPGWETVRASVSVTGTASDADPNAAPVLAAARARLPEPPSITERIAKAEWKDDTAVIRVRGAHKLAFYPRSGGLRIANLLESGVSNSDTLRLPVVRPPASPTSNQVSGPNTRPALRGLLEVFSPDGISRVYEVNLPMPPAR